jgi:hypothetical protein
MTPEPARKWRDRRWEKRYVTRYVNGDERVDVLVYVAGRVIKMQAGAEQC